MSQAWTFEGEPPGSPGTGLTLTLVEGSTFCISEAAGDILPDRAEGLFVRDTRVLSRWQLTIGGGSPTSMAVQNGAPYTATCLARVPPRGGLADSTLLIVRERHVGDGMREDLTVRNTGGQALAARVELRAAADFADLFEVKEGRVHVPDDVGTRVTPEGLQIVRRRGRHEQGVLIWAEGDPEVSQEGLAWDLSLPARQEWRATVEVMPVVDGVPTAPRHRRGEPVDDALPARQLRAWRRASPDVSTPDAGLLAVLNRSIDDLGTLRIYDPGHPERAVVAAGAPWFMALFGRDSLLTSWMLVPVNSRLALGTLQTLADHQGLAADRQSEEQPGKILHEIRFGPSTDFALGGRGIYYGSADSTPLFVMLLGELHRWGRHEAEVRALLPHADRALDWIVRHGDADGDGFVEYARQTDSGLVNQGWKDSGDGVNFADGRIADAPVALAEVQAYCYAAYRVRVRFAEQAGDEDVAKYWADRAAALRVAFNEAFWLPERRWFAIGLDADKRPIDALTSNIGHCLWTGIVDEEKAQAVADHLLSPDMFTGWGIRTLSRSMAAFNPMSYHNGSVWPHDNAICAAGLMRYGFVGHAQRVITGLLDAATYFGYRLPELFCGFGRDEFAEPVPYPAACSPQAWAAATPFSFLRTLFRFDPEFQRQQIWCDPHVPDAYLPLTVSGLRLGELSLDVEVTRQGWHLSGLEGTGIASIAPPTQNH